MKADSFDVVVIGAGVIGLSLAWRLRQAGATVAVLERGAIAPAAPEAAPSGQASWASAGMLAPFAETDADCTLLDLGLESLRLYPDFVDELSLASGKSVMLQGPGLIRTAETPEEADQLKRRLLWQQQKMTGLEYLERRDLERIEPALGPSAAAGVLSTCEKHIPPRILLRALAEAVVRTGARLCPFCPAEEMRANRGGHVYAIDTPQGDFTCGEVVLAGGAWTGGLAAGMGCKIPVRPMRGQVVALRCALLLSHTIYTSRGYLVPRADGRLIVGATEEDTGFTSVPIARDVQRLIEFAVSVAPALARAPFDAAWAGLRPASPDHLPILGSLPGWINLHVASGHYRNGILLTPITARMMTSWILKRERSPLFDLLSADRFQEPL